MTYDKAITVFTPVYNRADLINIVYTSLLKQNVDKEKFEWLVIDDGSSDNIKDVIDGYIKEDKINIRYFHKPNGGVHTAWNFGVEKANGEYFFRCDSDDEIFENTLSKLMVYIEKFSDRLSSDCVGITGLCERKNGESSSIIGGKFPEDIFISTGLEMNFKYNLKGERAGCMRTEILKQYPLPEPFDVNFVFESTMWYKIDRDYKTICVNDSFKYYTENGSDSISASIKNTISKEYSTSQFYSYSFYINEILDYMLLNKSYLLKILVNVTRRGLGSGRSFTQILNSIDGIKRKSLVTATMPLGIALYVKDKRKS